MKAIVSENEEALGLFISPEIHTIILKDKPILGLEFKQAYFSIQGSIDCIAKPCDSSIIVTLTRIGDPNFQQTFQLNKSKKKMKKLTILNRTKY